MKERNEALERLMNWARDAAPSESFVLSDAQRSAALAAWRRESLRDLNESFVGFLRWALVVSVAIMLLSILFNYSAFSTRHVAEVEHSPQMMFHARVATEFYVP